MAFDNRGVNPARRRFLGASAVAGGLLLSACGRNEPAPQPAPAANNQGPAKSGTVEALTYGVLLCGGNKINPHTNEKVFVFTQSNIDRILKTGGINEDNTKLIIDIGFLAHGVIYHPQHAHRVVVFEKKGRGACEIDLKENIITRRIQPSQGGEFYGHGAYSADASVLYATEYDRETYAGRMVLRDAADMKVIGDFPTYGEWPHDCQFIEDGKVVAITNGGGHIDGGAEPCVTFVDVEKGELIERITFDNALINAGHLMLSSKLDLAVTHAMREGLDNRNALGAMSIRPKGEKFRTMASPANVVAAMQGETLSLCMHEKSKVVAATNPYGAPDGLLTFWNYETGEFVKAINDIEQPRGVGLTIDGKYWVVTFGRQQPGVILLSTETHEPTDPPIAFAASSQGSHAYIHDYYSA